MSAPHPATQAGALPAVGDERAAFLDHWTRDVPEEYRAITRIRAEKDLLLGIGRGPLREAADAWQARAILAATQPNAAPAAEVVARSRPGFVPLTAEQWISQNADDSLLLKAGGNLSFQSGWNACRSHVLAELRTLAAPAAAIDAREQETLPEPVMLSLFEGGEKTWPHYFGLKAGQRVRVHTGEEGTITKTVNGLKHYQVLIRPNYGGLYGAWEVTPLASRSEAPEARPNAAGQEQDYPPLPEMQDLGDSGASNYGYDSQSMRDYVDTDRKARQLSACNSCLSQAVEARAALTSPPAVPETPTEKQRKLFDLADRIDHEQLWRWAGMDHDKMTPDQKDRLDAGVALRRYAHLWASGRWVVFPPEGPVHYSASTLDRAYEMAKK